MRSDDRTVVIEVSDDGPGIPSEILGSIFDPFFTTKGAVQGVGLGLFVAQGLVRSAGGRLSVSSDGTSRGATFTVRLSAASEAVERAVAPVASSSVAAAAGLPPMSPPGTLTTERPA